MSVLFGKPMNNLMSEKPIELGKLIEFSLPRCHSLEPHDSDPSRVEAGGGDPNQSPH
jgi:hypothetical protein